MRESEIVSKIIHRQVSGEVEYRLNFKIRDENEPQEMPKKQCKFIGCITRLNSENAKDQIFCSIHQIKVIEVIERNDDPVLASYYKRLIKENEKRLNTGANAPGSK